MALLLCAALLTVLLPVLAENTETFKSGDFEYVLLEDGTARIKKYIGEAETLDIPADLDGHAVSSIGNRAFYRCESLAGVTVPGSVTEIGNEAFGGCDSLTLTVPGNSFAEQYCKDNGLNYVLAEN